MCFGNMSKSLDFLHLNGNRFSGPIPSTFSKECSLRSINFNGNKLEGKLPESLANCSSLEGLDIGNNRIHGNFPYWTEAFPQLRVLVLRSNKFDGNMSPSSLTKHPFPMLQVLDISGNAFVGSVPERYINNFNTMINTTKDNIIGDESNFERSTSIIGKIVGRLYAD